MKATYCKALVEVLDLSIRNGVESPTATNHTPGPWELHAHKDGACPIVYGPNSSVYSYVDENEQTQTAREPLIALVYSDGKTLNQKDNARIISCAPEMLDALKDLSEYAEKAIREALKHNPNGWEWGTLPLDNAKRVISKAEGRA